MSEFEVTSLKIPSERDSAYRALLSDGSVELYIPDSISDDLRVDPYLLETSILLNAWLLPSPDRANRVLAQGSHHRRIISSATIPVTDLTGSQTGSEIMVVSKPTNNFELSKRELRAMDDLHKFTTVKGVLPFAALRVTDIYGDEQDFVISRLQKGVLPLEKLRIESLLPRERREFLRSLGMFTAEKENQGIIHNDFALRNIWYDITQANGKNGFDFGLFDLEQSEIVSGELLLNLRRALTERFSNEDLMEFHRIGMGFLDDAAYLTAELRELLPLSEVQEEFVASYLDSRIPIVYHNKLEEDEDRDWNYIFAA